MIKLNTLDLTVGGEVGFGGEEGGRGEGIRIKLLKTRVYQKLAAEDKLN